MFKSHCDKPYYGESYHDEPYCDKPYNELPQNEHNELLSNELHNNKLRDNELLSNELLRNENIVVAPTDTVYGLFGDATSDKAIQKIYKIKGRPSYNPLIVHVSNLEMAQEIADFSKTALDLARHFWIDVKQPLTLVLKAKSNNKISKYVTAGLSTIAIRCPAHPIAHQLIEQFGKPLAAPSANTSNRVSPTNALMVKNDLGNKVDLIIDGGECKVGIESTIIDTTRDSLVILRHGGVSKEVIEGFLNSHNEDSYNENSCNENSFNNDSLSKSLLKENTSQIVIAPGMLKKHYSPILPLRINALYPLPGEAFIGFGNCDKCDFNLSKTEDLSEAAKNLFKVINMLDDPKRFCGIAIMPIPNIGLGAGINDRLTRAQSKNT